LYYSFFHCLPGEKRAEILLSGGGIIRKNFDAVNGFEAKFAGKKREPESSPRANVVCDG